MRAWVLLLCLLLPSFAEAAKLRRVRKAVSGKRSQPSERSWSVNDNDFTLPTRALRPRATRRTGGRGLGLGRYALPPRYFGYPYWGRTQGYRWTQVETKRSKTVPEAKDWAGQLSLDTGSDLAGVGRFSFSGAIFTPSRLELHLETDTFFESTPEGGSDVLSAFGGGLAYRLAHTEAFQVRLGVLLRAMDAEGLQGGMRLFGGMNAFVGKPWVFAVSGSFGYLGEALNWDVRATGGVMLGPVELFRGYDHEQFGEVPIGGPVVGLRLWL